MANEKFSEFTGTELDTIVGLHNGDNAKSTVIRVTSDKVGIGTTTPEANLHIVGDFKQQDTLSGSGDVFTVELSSSVGQYNLSARNSGNTAGVDFSVSASAGVVISPVGNVPGLTVSDSGKFDSDSTANFTRFLVYDVQTAQLQRVKVGANGTGPGGVGRALFIDNE